MGFNHDAAIPQRTQMALSRLRELHIRLPKPVDAAAKQLAKVDAFQPPTVDAYAVRDAILAGADTDTLHALVLAELAETALRDGAAQAQVQASAAVLEAIRDCAADIHAQLAKLAEAAIDKLKAAAAIGDVPLEALVRAGRHRDAEVIASANVVEQQMRALFSLRDRLLWPTNRHPVVDVTVWRDPDLNGLGLIEGLRRDPDALWFPDFRSACELAERLHDERSALEAGVLAGTGGTE